MKNYNWYLFDLDNTILDFSKVSVKAFDALMHMFEIGNRPNLYSMYQKINSGYWKAYEEGKVDADVLRKGRFEDFLNAINFKTDADKMSQKYMDLVVDFSFEIHGAKEVLEQLHSKGKQIALITNGLSDVQHKRIAKHELSSYFQHIFISDELGVSKPNRAFFEMVHTQINKPEKSNVLVLGDNPVSDIQGARQFGYDTLFYNYKKLDNNQINSKFKIDTWNHFKL